MTTRQRSAKRRRRQRMGLLVLQMKRYYLHYDKLKSGLDFPNLKSGTELCALRDAAWSYGLGKKNKNRVEININRIGDLAQYALSPRCFEWNSPQFAFEMANMTNGGSDAIKKS